MLSNNWVDTRLRHRVQRSDAHRRRDRLRHRRRISW